MMWLRRYDSWGQAIAVCPNCLLNVLKMDSGLSKTPELCHAFLHWGELSLFAKYSQDKNDMSEPWPHMVHHVKVTHIAAQRVWWASKERDHVKSTGDAFQHRAAVWYRLSQNTTNISRCNALSRPAFKVTAAAFSPFSDRELACHFSAHQVWFQYNEVLWTEMLTLHCWHIIWKRDTRQILWSLEGTIW